MLKNKIKHFLIMIVFFVIILTSNDMVVFAENGNSTTDWKDWQQEDYWEWHTRTTTDDQAYNGKHIAIQDDAIDFYGYWQNSYKDFLYKNYQKSGKKIFEFRIDESKANYHTLEGAGFIFNADIINHKLSGYVLLFTEKEVCIYRLDNVEIDNFETTPSTTVASYGKLIQSVAKTNSVIHDLRVEATPTNIKIQEAEKEILNVNLDYSVHIGESFGLISSYLQHSCSILSQIQFSEVKIMMEDYKIVVKNTDLENHSITGGYFTLLNEKEEIMQQGRTDESGNFIVEGLPEGIYTIQQKEAPKCYILNKTISQFKVTGDGKVVDVHTGNEIDLVVKNEPLQIKIRNHVINSKEPIYGSKIGLYDENDNEIAIGITNEEGNIIFSGIQKGNYKYKQIQVANGYTINHTQYNCRVDEEGKVTFQENNSGIIYNEKSKIFGNTDNTISSKVIPKAGGEISLLKIGISIFLLITVFIIIVLRKYKQLK